MIEVQALIFDVFGTVVDWRGGLLAQLDSWGRKRGIKGDWPGLVDAWRMAYAPSMMRVRSGDQPWANLDELQRESIERLAPAHGAAGLDGAALDEMVRMWHHLPGWPDSSAGLHRLRKRYIIAPLSNGHTALLVRMAKDADLPWDTVFGADVFRHYKPDSETYLGAARLLDLDPGKVMLVAAHPLDLAAAAKYGLRTGYVSRPLEYGGGPIHRDIPKPGDFDVMVGDLEELARVMGC